MTFDEQVAALRGKVTPRRTICKKVDCNPEEWAANLDYHNAWAKDHLDKRRASSNAWRKANPKKFRATKKAWQKSNLDKVLAWNNEWKKQRYKNDPVYRMTESLRARQRQFFKGNKRPLSMVRDMGCTQEFFRQHITRQLTGDMTIENYGTVWHLDHIYPLSKASIVDNPVHFLAAANWRNLQPLPGPENLEKSDTVTPEAQALFDSLVQEFTRKGVAA
jgi:hypothetical protein